MINNKYNLLAINLLDRGLVVVHRHQNDIQNDGNHNEVLLILGVYELVN